MNNRKKNVNKLQTTLLKSLRRTFKKMESKKMLKRVCIKEVNIEAKAYSLPARWIRQVDRSTTFGGIVYRGHDFYEAPP